MSSLTIRRTAATASGIGVESVKSLRHALREDEQSEKVTKVQAARPSPPNRLTSLEWVQLRSIEKQAKDSRGTLHQAQERVLKKLRSKLQAKPQAKDWDSDKKPAAAVTEPHEHPVLSEPATSPRIQNHVTRPSRDSRLDLTALRKSLGGRIQSSQSQPLRITRSSSHALRGLVPTDRSLEYDSGLANVMPSLEKHNRIVFGRVELRHAHMITSTFFDLYAHLKPAERHLSMLFRHDHSFTADMALRHLFNLSLARSPSLEKLPEADVRRIEGFNRSLALATSTNRPIYRATTSTTKWVRCDSEWLHSILAEWNPFKSINQSINLARTGRYRHIRLVGRKLANQIRPQPAEALLASQQFGHITRTVVECRTDLYNRQINFHVCRLHDHLELYGYLRLSDEFREARIVLQSWLWNQVKIAKLWDAASAILGEAFLEQDDTQKPVAIQIEVRAREMQMELVKSLGAILDIINELLHAKPVRSLFMAAGVEDGLRSTCFTTIAKLRAVHLGFFETTIERTLLDGQHIQWELERVLWQKVLYTLEQLGRLPEGVSTAPRQERRHTQARRHDLPERRQIGVQKSLHVQPQKSSRSHVPTTRTQRGPSNPLVRTHLGSFKKGHPRFMKESPGPYLKGSLFQKNSPFFKKHPFKKNWQDPPPPSQPAS